MQEVEALDGSAVKVDRKTVVRLLQRGAEAGALEVHSVQLQPRSGVPARDFEIVTLPGGLTADTVSKVPLHIAYMHPDAVVFMWLALGPHQSHSRRSVQRASLQASGLKWSGLLHERHCSRHWRPSVTARSLTSAARFDSSSRIMSGKGRPGKLEASGTKDARAGALNRGAGRKGRAPA